MITPTTPLSPAPKLPFSSEEIPEAGNKIRYRIRDSNDDAYAASHTPEHASLVVDALNAFFGVVPPIQSGTMLEQLTGDYRSLGDEPVVMFYIEGHGSVQGNLLSIGRDYVRIRFEESNRIGVFRIDQVNGYSFIK